MKNDKKQTTAKFFAISCWVQFVSILPRVNMKKPSKCARFLLLSCALYCLPLPGYANGNSDRVLSSKLDQLQDKYVEFCMKRNF